MKLYPPQIEGTLPSIYISSENMSEKRITVPFTMNPAVGANEIGGFSLRVREVINGNELFTINTNSYNSTTEAVFALSTFELIQFKIGSYYKFQLAYINTEGETGYYSTVGVVKCTSKPTLEIKGLDLQSSNFHKYSYTGFYANPNDPTEKVYSYRFVIKENVTNEIFKDSGEILHNVENNSDNRYESTDTYTFSYDLDKDKVYLIQYTIKTNNNMVIKTPWYRIIQAIGGEITEPIKLVVKSDFDDGFVNMVLMNNKEENSQYTLWELSVFDESLDYYIQDYELVTFKNEDYESGKYYIKEPKYVEAINLTKEKYSPGRYYIYDRNKNIFIQSWDKFNKSLRYFDKISYQLQYGNERDPNLDYYKLIYSKIYLDEEQFLLYQESKKKLYIKTDHFARGNFLISRSSKDSNYQEWNPIATVKVEGYQKEFYNKNDYTVEQGKFYRYALQQYNQYGVLSKRQEAEYIGTNNKKEMFIDFEDCFLYDGEKQLKIRYNPKISSFKTNIIESKIDTIGGKFPFFFRNGNVCYKEFPISGLISYKMDDNQLFMSRKDLGFDPKHKFMQRTFSTIGKKEILDRIKENRIRANNVLNQLKEKGFSIQNQKVITAEQRALYNVYINIGTQIDNLKEMLNNWETTTENLNNQVESDQYLSGLNYSAEREFKLEVLDWLNNGKPKLFRSPGEGNYIVRLMNVSLSPEDAVGRMLHNFSTTAYEIADCNYNNLTNLNIVKVDELDYKFLLWKTIRFSEPKGTRKNSDGTIYYRDRTSQSYPLYFGEVKYNYDELLDRETFNVQFQDMIPGTMIQIDGQEIVIGNTGAYYIASEKGINSILVPPNSTYQGCVTFNYYGITTGRFDLEVNEYLSQVGARQFIGNGEDIIQKIENPISKIEDFGYLQFVQRDIVNVSVTSSDFWEKTYYEYDDLFNENIEIKFKEDFTDEELFNNFYYYEDPEIKDRYVKLEVTSVNDFENDKIYFLNNKSGLNRFKIGDSNKKSSYNFSYSENFSVMPEDSIYYYLNKGEYIDPYTNQMALYRYETTEIPILENIKVLEDSIVLYKDILYNKYYVDKDTYQNLTDEELKEFVDILSFEIILKHFDREEPEVISILNHNNYHLKGSFNFEQIILGNGTVLNCSYQTHNTTYIYEVTTDPNNEFYDEKLQDLKSQLEYYDSIINGTSNSEEQKVLGTLEDIMAYYKENLLNNVLNEIVSSQSLETVNKDIISNYQTFLEVYEKYLNGQVIDLEDFKIALNNEEEVKELDELITDQFAVLQDAREKYVKIYEEYVNLLEKLLEGWEEKADVL